MRALCPLSTYDGKRSAVVLNVILSITSWCNIYVPLFLSIVKWNYKMGYCLSRKISMYLPTFSVLLSNCTVFKKELLYCILFTSQGSQLHLQLCYVKVARRICIKFCMMIEFNFHIAWNLQQGQYNVNILNHGDINS